MLCMNTAVACAEDTIKALLLLFRLFMYSYFLPRDYSIDSNLFIK